MMRIYDVITQNSAACDVLQAVPQTASIYTGVIILRNGTECSVALLSGTEQLFNISLR